MIRRQPDAAVPGRYPTPRNVTFGGSQMRQYMRCLNDPFSEPPCRPGVGCALPTGLFTCYQRFPVVVNNFISMVFMPNRLQFPVMVSTTGAAPYSYGNLSPNYPQYTTISQLYEKARLLAGGFRLIPTMPSLTDGGSVTSALIPSIRVSDVVNFGQVLTTAAIYGVNEYPNFPESLVTPFKVGASVYWRPQDPNSFVFKESPITDSSTGSASSSFIQETLQGVPFIVMSIAGMSTNAQFTVEIISHFEGTIAAGNTGVIDLQRANPVTDSSAIAAADRVFGDSNRTAKPGWIGPYNSNLGSSKGGTVVKGDFWKDALNFGSSVAPLLLGLL